MSDFLPPITELGNPPGFGPDAGAPPLESPESVVERLFLNPMHPSLPPSPALALLLGSPYWRDPVIAAGQRWVGAQLAGRWRARAARSGARSRSSRRSSLRR